jgi:hypothetical protein
VTQIRGVVDPARLNWRSVEASSRGWGLATEPISARGAGRSRIAVSLQALNELNSGIFRRKMDFISMPPQDSGRYRQKIAMLLTRLAFYDNDGGRHGERCATKKMV